MFFRSREVAAVELYGKLPLAKDYLRVGCSAGSAIAWREWLDRSYSGGAGVAPAELARPARFVAGDALGDPLIGCLWPSSDSGGLRRFPFTLFVARKRKSAARDLEQGLGVAAALWAALEELYAQARACADGQSLLAAMRGREIDVDRLAPAARASVDFGTWRDLLGPTLDSALLRLSDLRGSRTDPLRLPLAAGLDAREQTLAWWWMCREIGIASARELPTLVLPGATADAGRASCLLVFRRAPVAGDAAWLAPPSDARVGEGDLCASGSARSGGAPSASEARLPLSDALRNAWLEVAARRERP